MVMDLFIGNHRTYISEFLLGGDPGFNQGSTLLSLGVIRFIVARDPVFPNKAIPALHGRREIVGLNIKVLCWGLDERRNATWPELGFCRQGRFVKTTLKNSRHSHRGKGRR